MARSGTKLTGCDVVYPPALAGNAPPPRGTNMQHRQSRGWIWRVWLMIDLKGLCLNKFCEI